MPRKILRKTLELNYLEIYNKEPFELQLTEFQRLHP